MRTAPQEEETGDDAHMVKFRYYDTVEMATDRWTDPDDHSKGHVTTKHIKLVSATKPFGEFMAFYRKHLAYYVYHRYSVQHTTRVRKQRAGFDSGDVSVIMDYSEKLNRLRRKEVQSEHWETTAMTIEVAVTEFYRAALDDEERAEIERKWRAADDLPEGAAMRGSVMMPRRWRSISTTIALTTSPRSRPSPRITST